MKKILKLLRLSKTEDTDYSKVWEGFNDNNLPQIRAFFDRRPDTLFIDTPLGSWLHYAASKSSIDIVEYFVEKGLDINRKDPLSTGNPLDEAARSGRFQTVEYFLNKGADLDVSFSTGNPLFSAIIARSSEIVELLLAAGIDATKRYTTDTLQNMDAIAFAFERGEFEIAKIIAQHLVQGDEKKAQQLLEEGDQIARLNNK